MISSVVSWLVGGLFDLLALLVGLLPRVEMPDVSGMVSSSGASEYFGWLNWVLPVSTLVSITAAWAAGLLGYQAYRVFKSWFRTFKS